MNFSWKKGIFFLIYKFFFGEQEVGYLKDCIWSCKVEGVFNEIKVFFWRKGVFSNKVEIIDMEIGEMFGQIEMSIWKNKVSIILGEKMFKWRFFNNWNIKWELLEDGNLIVKYKSCIFSGEVELQIEDELMMLIGFFIFNYFI